MGFTSIFSNINLRGLLSKELEEIFREAPAAPNALANTQLREAYARATSRSTETLSEDSSKERAIRTFNEDDDCAICYDTLHGHAAQNLSICYQCSNAVHKECFQHCMFHFIVIFLSLVIDNANHVGSRSARHRQVTCVYCRAIWTDDGKSNSSSQNAKNNEGYINLSGVAGISPIRDTSSCTISPPPSLNDVLQLSLLQIITVLAEGAATLNTHSSFHVLTTPVYCNPMHE